MRDLAQSTSTAVATVTMLANPPSQYQTEMMTFVRGRDSPVSTVPGVNGKYYLPSNYGGGKADVTLFPVDYKAFFYASMKPGVHYTVKGTSGAFIPPSSAQEAWKTGCFLMNGRLYPSVTQDLRSESQTRALNRIHDKDFNLGIFLGELGATTRMFASAVEVLVKALGYAIGSNWYMAARTLWDYLSTRAHNFSRTTYSGGPNLDRLANALKNGASRSSLPAADLWLLYNYGWRPLVNDIYGLAELMAKQESQKPPLLRARAEVRVENPLPWTGALYPSSGTSRTGAETVIYFRVSNPELFALASLGLLNPASLAWELVPLSFVVDWIVPIGPFLEAMTAGVGIELSHAYRKEYTKSNFTMFWTYTPHGVSGTPDGQHVKNFASMRFDVGATVLIPLPWIRSGFNFTKLLTSLALIRQRI